MFGLICNTLVANIFYREQRWNVLKKAFLLFYSVCQRWYILKIGKMFARQNYPKWPLRDLLWPIMENEAVLWSFVNLSIIMLSSFNLESTYISFFAVLDPKIFGLVCPI